MIPTVNSFRVTTKEQRWPYRLFFVYYEIRGLDDEIYYERHFRLEWLFNKLAMFLTRF